MRKKHIAILAGGDEHIEMELSLKTAKKLRSIIDEDLYNIHIVFLEGNDWHLRDERFESVQINKHDFSLSVNNYSKTIFDCVIFAIHGRPAEDGKLAAYFNLINMPYISSGVLSSSLSFNKYHCNSFLNSLNIKTPKSVFYIRSDVIRAVQIIEKLGLPCFVKPNASNSSFGISKVQEITDLDAAIKKALLKSEDLIIEEYIEGKELSCSLIKTKSTEVIFPLTEIEYEGDFFDFKAKFTPSTTKRTTPAKISGELEEECKLMASKIYEALNCSGLVSLDFIVAKNQLYFIDIDTVPYISDESTVNDQLRATPEISLTNIYTELIEEVIYDKNKKLEKEQKRINNK